MVCMGAADLRALATWRASFKPSQVDSGTAAEGGFWMPEQQRRRPKCMLSAQASCVSWQSRKYMGQVTPNL